MLTDKVLTVVTLFVAAAVTSFAQTRTVEHEYSEFDAVSISNGFKVTFSSGNGASAYSTKVTVDDALEGYVQCYVKARTLYIGLDEKSIPKDLKKTYKGKNAPDPVLTAIVYVPTINSITLNDDSSFASSETLNSGDFKLDLSDNASISNLKVVASKASISVRKKAKLSSINIKADDIAVKGDDDGGVTLEYASKSLSVDNAGSANLILNGETGNASVATAGGAQMSLSGKASSLKVTGKGNSSKVDASSFAVDDAMLSFSGADVMVNASKSLELELGKGASVNYAGDPDIKIVSIQNATVSRK